MLTSDDSARVGEPIVVNVDPELADLVPAFLMKRRADVSTLRSAVERGDLAAIGRLGHDLKGTGSAYGFDEITRLGARLQQGAQAANAAATLVAVAELAAYLDRVKVVFR